MEKKLYVGNLPYTVQEDELSTMFSEFGNVESVVIISDRASGRSKGFGFVEYDDGESANSAVEGLNGKEIAGRKMIVSEARPQENRRPRRY